MLSGPKIKEFNIINADTSKESSELKTIHDNIAFISDIPIDPEMFYIGDLGLVPDKEVIQSLQLKDGKYDLMRDSYSSEMMLNGKSSEDVSLEDEITFKESGMVWKDIVKFFTFLGACCATTYNKELKYFTGEARDFRKQEFDLIGFGDVKVSFPLYGAPQGFGSVEYSSYLGSSAFLKNALLIQNTLEPLIKFDGIEFKINMFTQLMVVFHHLLQKGAIDILKENGDLCNVNRSQVYAINPSDVISLIKKIAKNNLVKRVVIVKGLGGQLMSS